MTSEQEADMSTATVTGPGSEVLYSEVSDQELEAAAQEAAMSYTYQTSAYQMCCS